MSKPHYHAVIWIDHREARIFHFNSTDVERLVLHPDNPTKHIHHKANSIGSGHASPDHDYLQAVAESVADAGAVLITGPANAKTELADHIRLHDPALAKVIAPPSHWLKSSPGSKLSTIRAIRNSSLMRKHT